MQQNIQTTSELRTKLEKDYRSGRNNIILLIILTLVNIALALFASGSYFLFSAQIPYFIFLVGLIAGGYSAFSEVGAEFFPEIIIVTSGIAAFILLLYLLCFIFAGKNRYGWIIGALVMYVFDTIFSVCISLPDFDASVIIDIALHAAILISLVKSIVAAVKLNKLDSEATLSDAAPITEAPSVAADTETAVENTEDPE